MLEVLQTFVTIISKNPLTLVVEPPCHMCYYSDFHWEEHGELRSRLFPSNPAEIVGAPRQSSNFVVNGILVKIWCNLGFQY